MCLSFSSYSPSLCLTRWATWLAFGYLLEFEPSMHAKSAASAVASSAVEQSLYEFSLNEERIVRTATEAANLAGLALVVQTVATLMLTAAEFGIEVMSVKLDSSPPPSPQLVDILFLSLGEEDQCLMQNWPGVVSNGINSVNKALMAILIFQVISMKACLRLKQDTLCIAAGSHIPPPDSLILAGL